ncbi:MAG: bifunctional diguanylate cyclase/phosphodiesterase [Campylobacterota bacterium]|nr:bifunctional diguanylate cyclase/phosphodiesterase [Campylobacterota bacterium]
MYFTSKYGKLFFLLIVLLPVMTAISIYLYNKYTQTSQEISDITYNDLITKQAHLFKNYVNNIHVNLGDEFLNRLQNSQELRNHYEESLSILLTDEVKYLYILYVDKNEDKLRYLIDTAQGDDRAEYGQKFDVQSSIWKKAFESKEVQMSQQNSLDTLWISYAHPIKSYGKVQAFLGADFSNDAHKRIVDVAKPLEKLYFYITVFMIIMLITAYVQLIMYTINRRKSHIDPLTKVYNRQYFYDLLETLNLDEYQIMMIDLDHFKQVNDVYGHDVGDIVLESLSKRFLSAIRTDDILIRYGGEEFLLLLHSKSLEQCDEVSKRIQHSVKSLPVRAGTHSINTTVSIGVNPYPSFAKNIDEAIKIADEQLYKAKVAGRDKVVILQESNKLQSFSSKRISDVKDAINEDRMKCAYQPIFNTKTLDIQKYEVLIRMVDNDGKIIFPGEFLPSISNTQTYIRLTKLILETAFDKIRSGDVELAINLSLQDIYNDDIMKTVTEVLNDNKSLAHRLTFELLETEEIVNFELIQERIDKIKSQGAKIAIDDFGSGYANFKYLVHLGVDILKIDGSLIRNIDSNKNVLHIVETICSFANKMNIKTVAEQVETEDELKILQDIGVSYVQGFYLAKPGFELHFS